MLGDTNSFYKDLNLSFLIHPITGDVSSLSGADAVKRAIRNLVFTENYEVPFHPDKGCAVRAQLFEHITPITEYKLKTSIETVIQRFEPRAQISTVKVNPQPDSNLIEIDIVFFIRNVIDPVNVKLFLEKTR